MVFQDLALFPHMTVFENIAFGLRVRKMPAAEITELVACGRGGHAHQAAAHEAASAMLRG